MGDKKSLDPSGLNQVWLKTWQLIKSLTGSVDTTKGTLQEQIDDLAENASSGIDITKAEYEALVEAGEVQTDVDYYITDEQPDYNKAEYVYYDDETSVKEKIDELIVISDMLSNPNLLDNPWFTVNQRGQSEYTGAGYTVDRWIHEFDSKNCQSKFAKNNDSITIKQISNNGSNFWNCIMQKMPVETVKNIIGKTVTLSVLHRGKGSTMLHVMKESNSSVIANKIFANNETWEVSSITFTIDTEDVTMFRVYSDVTGQSGYTEIKAVKLELGSVSTLANDVAPNYALELIKCSLSKADSTDTYANKTITFS